MSTPSTATIAYPRITITPAGASVVYGPDYAIMSLDGGVGTSIVIIALIVALILSLIVTAAGAMLIKQYVQQRQRPMVGIGGRQPALPRTYVQDRTIAALSRSSKTLLNTAPEP